MTSVCIPSTCVVNPVKSVPNPSSAVSNSFIFTSARSTKPKRPGFKTLIPNTAVCSGSGMPTRLLI